jgi:hypothetical protein
MSLQAYCVICKKQVAFCSMQKVMHNFAYKASLSFLCTLRYLCGSLGIGVETSQALQPLLLLLCNFASKPYFLPFAFGSKATK